MQVKVRVKVVLSSELALIQVRVRDKPVPVLVLGLLHACSGVSTDSVTSKYVRVCRYVRKYVPVVVSRPTQ